MAIKKKPSKNFAISEKITPISESVGSLSLLIYGKSGTGKTAFSATLPKPILLLDIREKGTDTIASVEGIDRLAIDSWGEFEEAHIYLKSGEHKYKSVVLDQVSTLQDLAMEKVRADENMKSADLISKRNWGQISGMMKTWLFAYRDLTEDDLHVCFIAHDRSQGGEETLDDQIDPTIGPRLMPSVASGLNGAVDMIGNTFIRERFEKDDDKKKIRLVEYAMRIGPHAYYTSKIRRPVAAGAPPDVLVDPTFDKIAAIIRGESVKRKLKRKE